MISRTTTLIISNEEMNDIMKIVQALEDSNTLLKRVTKTIISVWWIFKYVIRYIRS